MTTDPDMPGPEDATATAAGTGPENRTPNTDTVSPPPLGAPKGGMPSLLAPRLLLPLTLVIVLILFLGWFFQFGGPNPTLIGPDVHFHVAISRYMGEHGLANKSFDRAVESTWAEHWFDKDWLFHVYLLPFISKLGVIAGSKWAALGLLAATFVAFVMCLRALQVPWPTLWLLLLPFTGGWIYWLRLMLCRPHMLGTIWVLLAMAAMFKRRGPLLAAVMVLYSLSHASHWMLPFMTVVYDVVYAVTDENGRRRDRLARSVPMTVWVLGGFVVGTMIHPNFPNNVSGLFLQNVLVLKTYWQAKDDLAGLAPTELAPFGISIFLMALPLTVGLLLAGIRWAAGPRRWSRELWVLGVFAGGFAVLAFRSVRFIDYCVPFGLLWLAVYFVRNPLGFTGQTVPTDAERAAGAEEPEPRVRPLLIHIVLVLLVAVPGLSAYGTAFRKYAVEMSNAQGGVPLFAAAAAWIDKWAPADEIVYTTRWIAPPGLFLGAPRQRYLMFLDPMYMYRHDRDRFMTWRTINNGDHPDPVAAIRDIFDSRIVLVWLNPELQAQLEASPEAHAVLRGPQGELLYIIGSLPPGVQPLDLAAEAAASEAAAAAAGQGAPAPSPPTAAPSPTPSAASPALSPTTPPTEDAP